MSEECQTGWWQDINVLLKGWEKNKYLCDSELLNQIATAYAICFILSAFSAAITQQVAISIILPFILTTFFIMPNLLSLMIVDRQVVGKHESSLPQKDYVDDPMKTSWIQNSNEPLKKGKPLQNISVTEGFMNSNGKETGSLEPALTFPNAKNPFMNVSPEEPKYTPFRSPAADVNDPDVKKYLDNFFRVQWFSDPTDVFGKSQNQRQFYTMPSTSIPNDEESYRNWLYKIPFKTCKEGGRQACVPGSGGGYLPSLQVNEN